MEPPRHIRPSPVNTAQWPSPSSPVSWLPIYIPLTHHHHDTRGRHSNLSSSASFSCFPNIFLILLISSSLDHLLIRLTCELDVLGYQGRNKSITNHPWKESLQSRISSSTSETVIDLKCRSAGAHRPYRGCQQKRFVLKTTLPGKVKPNPGNLWVLKCSLYCMWICEMCHSLTVSRIIIYTAKERGQQQLLLKLTHRCRYGSHSEMWPIDFLHMIRRY